MHSGHNSNIPRIHQGSLRILVIEDDLVFNTFYKSFLATKSAEVVSCLCLAEAMQVLVEPGITFDAVILDNQLTDGEGISLLPFLQQGARAPAVIMVSGNDDPEFFLTSFAAGIDDYMVKPVNLELLWVKINKAVNQHRLSQLSLQQHAELEVWIEQEQQQQTLAKHLFDTMFLQIHQQHPAIHVWMQPSGVFSGDAVLRRQANDGSWYFIMADAMGHGLAPAVSLMPLMQHFQMLVSKSLPLANIVFDLNGMLNSLLPPDRFVAALLMRIDPWCAEIEVWNAGMPTLQCLNAEGQLIAKAAATHMALGVLTNHQISAAPQVISLKEIDHLVMFSDGLTETMLPSGQMLDSSLVASQLQLTGSDRFSRLRQLFDGLAAEDDISVCLIDCRALLQSQPQIPAFLTDQTSSFSTQFHFSGGALRTADIPQQAVDLLRSQSLPQAFLQRVFTVLTELFVNALEHGVLQLDSQLKEQPDGFCQFYEEKERRLELLTDQHFIEFLLCWSSVDSTLTAKCTDSGDGFIPILAATEEQTISYGRGLRLIQQLTQHFHIEPPGNCFTVVMSPDLLKTNNDKTVHI